MSCDATYRQLLDGRWQRIPKPEEPERVSCWYMRDNHTFLPLPLDVEAALVAMREERDNGATYGMLCGSPRALLDDAHGVVHARSAADWPEFEAAARPWLERAVALSKPPA